MEAMKTQTATFSVRVLEGHGQGFYAPFGLLRPAAIPNLAASIPTFGFGVAEEMAPVADDCSAGRRRFLAVSVFSAAFVFLGADLATGTGFAGVGFTTALTSSSSVSESRTELGRRSPNKGSTLSALRKTLFQSIVPKSLAFFSPFPTEVAISSNEQELSISDHVTNTHPGVEKVLNILTLKIEPSTTVQSMKIKQVET